MINAGELAICKRRGHNPELDLHNGWVECKWCGTWLREVLDEREDEPPTAEMNPLIAARCGVAGSREILKRRDNEADGHGLDY